MLSRACTSRVLSGVYLKSTDNILFTVSVDGWPRWEGGLWEAWGILLLFTTDALILGARTDDGMNGMEDTHGAFDSIVFFCSC